jgi:hypothetical protein
MAFLFSTKKTPSAPAALAQALPEPPVPKLSENPAPPPREPIASMTDAEYPAERRKALGGHLPTDGATISDAGVLRGPPLADGARSRRDIRDVEARTEALKRDPWYRIAFGVAACMPPRKAEDLLSIPPAIEHARPEREVVTRPKALPELFLPADYCLEVLLDALKPDGRRAIEESARSAQGLNHALLGSLTKATLITRDGIADGTFDFFAGQKIGALSTELKAVVADKTPLQITAEDVVRMKVLKQAISEYRIALEQRQIQGAYEVLPGFKDDLGGELGSLRDAVRQIPGMVPRKFVEVVNAWDKRFNNSAMADTRKALNAQGQSAAYPSRWAMLPQNTGRVVFTEGLSGALSLALEALKETRKDLAQFMGDEPVRFVGCCSESVKKRFFRLTAIHYREGELLGGPRRPEDFKAVTSRNDTQKLSLLLDFRTDLRMLQFPTRRFYFVYETSEDDRAPNGYVDNYAGYDDEMDGLPIFVRQSVIPRLARMKYYTQDDAKEAAARQEVFDVMSALSGGD